MASYRTVPFDPSTTPASLAIVERVADHLDLDPMSLPPLYEVIDPEAIDALFDQDAMHRSFAGEVSFLYSGVEVHLSCGDEIRIELEDIDSAHAHR